MGTHVEPRTLDRGRGIREIWRSLLGLQEAAMIIPVAAVTLYFYSVNPVMLSPVTVRSVLFAVAYPGLVAMGLVLLMIAGEIDLSTCPVMGLCAVSAAWLMNHAGWPSWAGAAAGLLLALGVGLFNGVLTVKLGAPSLVVTLAVRYSQYSRLVIRHPGFEQTFRRVTGGALCDKLLFINDLLC